MTAPENPDGTAVPGPTAAPTDEADTSTDTAPDTFADTAEATVDGMAADAGAHEPAGDPLDGIRVASEADVVATEIEVPVEEEPEQLPGVLAARLADPDELRSAIEAVLFVVEAPVTVTMLAATLEQTTDAVQQALDELRTAYDERSAGMELREVAGGVRLYTRAEHADVVEHFLRDGQKSRLSQAALETLAVIAYRQPVTRARVSAIRGVNVDGVVRTLLARGLVVEVGSDPISGGGLFRTTDLFLERMGLRSLDELPSLAPLLPDVDTVDDLDGFGNDLDAGLDSADAPSPSAPAVLTSERD
ncbi:SMC-Scp complex subunit ScpB [Jatrophihabitans fulvus]